MAGSEKMLLHELLALNERSNLLLQEHGPTDAPVQRPVLVSCPLPAAGAPNGPLQIGRAHV